MGRIVASVEVENILNREKKSDAMLWLIRVHPTSFCRPLGAHASVI